MSESPESRECRVEDDVEQLIYMLQRALRLRMIAVLDDFIDDLKTAASGKKYSAWDELRMDIEDAARRRGR